MPTYTYKARDTTGKQVKGVMSAAGKEEVVDKLRKMGYMTTKVNESLSAGMKLDLPLDKLRRVSSEDMVMFSVQLANLVNAGINILSSLDALVRQIENKVLKEAVGSVRRNVEAGMSLSQSFEMYPRVFSYLFIHMVKAGEASGKLGLVLTRFSQFSEDQSDLNQKIKGALFYPMILLGAGITVTLFIVTFIIPQFVAIFTQVGITLPLITVILYKVGIGIKQFWYLGIGAAVLVWWLVVKVYIKTERGRLSFDRFKLKIFIAGPLHRKAVIARFTRTLGTLLSSGVPILESLDIVKGVLGNEVFVRVVEGTRGAVEKGEKISQPLKVSEEFPADAVQMIAAGEETGNLSGMLDKIAAFYERSLGYSVKKLTTIIEPVFLVIMGCMIGFIMASMLLPMFDMVKILRH